MVDLLTLAFQIMLEATQPKVYPKEPIKIMNLYDMSRSLSKQDNEGLVKKVLADFKKVNVKFPTANKTYSEFYVEHLGEFIKNDIGDSPDVVFVAYEVSSDMRDEEKDAVMFMLNNLKEHDIFMPIFEDAGHTEESILMLENQFDKFWLQNPDYFLFKPEHKAVMASRIIEVGYESRKLERVHKYNAMIDLCNLHDKAIDNPILWPKYHSLFFREFDNAAFYYGRNMEKFSNEFVHFLDKVDSTDRLVNVTLPILHGVLQSKNKNQTIYMLMGPEKIGTLFDTLTDFKVGSAVFTSY